MSHVAEKMPVSLIEARGMLWQRNRRTIASNTFVQRDDIYGPVELVHRRSVIATFHTDGSVTLDTQGYRTTPTLARLRPIARAFGFNLYKCDGELLLASLREPRVCFRFFDGIRLTLDTMDADAEPCTTTGRAIRQ
jgi:hypothetical protein